MLCSLAAFLLRDFCCCVVCASVIRCLSMLCWLSLLFAVACCFLVIASLRVILCLMFAVYVYALFGALFFYDVV